MVERGWEGSTEMAVLEITDSGSLKFIYGVNYDILRKRVRGDGGVGCQEDVLSPKYSVLLCPRAVTANFPSKHSLPV